MDQVLIQRVMDAQGEVSLEYLADLVRRLPPRRSSSCWPLLRPSWTRTPKELQAGPRGRLPHRVCQLCPPRRLSPQCTGMKTALAPYERRRGRD